MHLRSLLDVARVSHDRISLQLEPVDLQSVIELAAQAESGGLQEKRAIAGGESAGATARD